MESFSPFFFSSFAFAGPFVGSSKTTEVPHIDISLAGVSSEVIFLFNSLLFGDGQKALDEEAEERQAI